MQRYLLLFLFLPFFLFAKESVTVAIDYEYAPFTYKSFEGKPEGLFVEFWKLWSKTSGYDVKFKFYDWDGTLEAVKNGEVIFHSGLTPDAKWMVASDKFYEIKTSFYKLKNRDLPKKLRIGSIDEYYMELAQKRYPHAKVIKYKNYLPLIKDMLDHKIDLFIDDEIAVDTFLLQKGVKPKFETTGKSFYSDIKVITNKKNQKYIEIFNKYLKKMKANDFAAIKKDFLGSRESFSNSNDKIIFTPKEQAWLDKKEPLKYVYDPDWAPFEYNNGINVHTGIIADIFKIFKKESGINLQPIHTKTWAQAVELVKNKKADMFSAIPQTKERQKYVNFTKRYIFKYYGSLVGQINDTTDYTNLKKALKSKKIGVVKGYTIASDMKKKYPDLDFVYVKTVKEGFDKLKNGSIDLFAINIVTAQYFINNKHYNSLKIASKLDFEYGLKIAIRKDKPAEIISIFNKLINHLDEQQVHKIYDKWIKNNTLDLTKKEQEFIKNHNIIYYKYSYNIEPFEYINDLKKHSGITADIINLIEQKSGLNFQPLKMPIDTKKDQKIDMLSFVLESKDTKKDWNFTNKTLFEIPTVVVTKENDTKSYENIKYDLKAKKIGVDKTIYKQLLQKYPNLHFIVIDSIAEGFEMVRSGALDLFILNQSSAKYYIKAKGFDNIKIATTVDLILKYKMALKKSLPPEALSIINKALEDISDDQLNEIYNKYMNVRVQKDVDWLFLLQIAGVMFVLLLFILYHNRKLKFLVDDKTKELSLLLDTFDEHVIASKTDKKGIITDVSRAFCDISGFSAEELIGKPHNIIRHPDTPKEIFEDMWQTIKAGKIWRGEIKNLKKDGGFYWATHIVFPEYDKNGKIKGYGSIRHDITAQKKVEELTQNLERKIKERTKDLSLAKKEIEAAHKRTRESIEYAAKIQSAIVSQQEEMRSYFKDSMVLWEPKDTVGGDIWLFNNLRHKDECLILVIDCTGHGVPGALVTMIVKAIELELTTSIKKHPEIDISPAKILIHFNKTMKKLLKQERKEGDVNAGFDGGIIYYNRRQQVIKFAGAKTPLFYIDENHQLQTIKGDRYSVGYKECRDDYNYKESIIPVRKGMKFYCTTDGYLDQNGGTKDLPFGKKRFANIIKQNHTKSMEEQKRIFIDELQKYQSEVVDNERNDDITVIGFEIDEKSKFEEIFIEEIFRHKGIITQSIIASALDNIEMKVKNIDSISKISTITIEYCQNIMNYSKNEDAYSKQIVPVGEISIQNLNDEYYEIMATNVLSLDDKDKLEAILKEIQSFDKKMIKKRYKELRKSGVNTHDLGGGIGMYEIAKASDSIEYIFKQINADKCRFSIKSIVKLKSE